MPDQINVKKRHQARTPNRQPQKQRSKKLTSNSRTSGSAIAFCSNRHPGPRGALCSEKYCAALNKDHKNDPDWMIIKHDQTHRPKAPRPFTGEPQEAENSDESLSDKETGGEEDGDDQAANDEEENDG